MKDILKVYNKAPEPKKSVTISRPEGYTTVLYRDVPKSKIPVSSPEFDKEKCWHCQDNTRIKADPDVIIWCERCYILHLKKFDGTYIEHKTIPAFKKLVKDIDDGKFKDVALEPHEGKLIQE